MNNTRHIRHEFVDMIPDHLEDQVVYISIAYTTAVHLCCCGCKSEVVTPLSPTDWSVMFDGQSISLRPSIGNWSFQCQSHYWIQRNQIRWARRWSHDEIAIGRERDTILKEAWFAPDNAEPAVTAPIQPARSARWFWRWIQRLWPRRRHDGQSVRGAPQRRMKP